MSEKKEFGDICAWLSSFCVDPEYQSFRSKLKKISELNLMGWEKWLQIEFAIFLHNHPDIVFENDSREYGYYLDGRKAARCKAYADFRVRKKYASKYWRIVLEFKVKNSQTSCIREMLADCGKIWNVRGSNDDMRAFWVVGFHKSDGKTVVELKENALKLVKKTPMLNIRESMLECMLIGRSGYALTVF